MITSADPNLHLPPGGDAFTRRTPAVSVVMPVYNAQPFLEEAIQSVLDQTFRDFEFIIVDDGSTDDSLAVIRGFAARDGRIRFISRPNTGASGASNDGFAMARAPLIARMDADDVCLPTRFERQVEYLESHPECVMVGADVLFIDADGDPIMLQDHPCDHEAIDVELLKGKGGALHQPVVMGRREAIMRCGGYHDYADTAEDLDLFLRLAEIGRLANLRETLLHYRIHANSISHRRQEKQALAVRASLDAAWQRRGLPGQPPPFPIPDWTDDLAATYRLWTLWALRGGNHRTARKFARRLLRHRPFKPDSWRVCVWALQGRP